MALKEDGDGLDSGLVEVQQDSFCTAMRVDILVIPLAVVDSKGMHHEGKVQQSEEMSLEGIGGLEPRRMGSLRMRREQIDLLATIIEEARGQHNELCKFPFRRRSKRSVC
ncbi:hypothetical protein BKA70DRAFT_1241872 [Coprinopsis sp. MPI-PUGE-AT-0042]|nr:hypothetical protein BKA70DRAFT_1241872 [Coprinopsis sp. MPI-PUGE-AT-0042]